eukprot:gene8676-6241_t
MISKLITVAKSKMFMSVEHLLPEMHEKTVAYFIRSFDGVVPRISESPDATVMASQLEFNVMFGEVLQGIANVMQHIYMPVVQKGKITDDLDIAEEAKAPEARESLRNELNLNIAKFEQQIRHVVVQSKGDTRLTIPNLNITNPVTASEDSHIVTEIESAVSSWTKVLLEAVDMEHQKMTKSTRTPLGEIDFWRERNANLSALYDQLNSPKVQMMVEVLRRVDNPHLSTFNYHFGDLAKMYLEARNNKIEETGSDHRWEFDRKALFGKTDYMAEICENILEIVNSIDHFRVFLGPELKAVTGDTAGIDEVIKRVEGLTIPLKIPFEEKIFDKSYEKAWETIIKKFRASVIEIEKMTEQFIKESFRKLRSAEGAFELVQNFQKIGNTGGQAASNNASVAGGFIQQQISDRYKDILEQYLNELTIVKQLFVKNKDRPQLYKNFPPVAGAIAWARDLYLRAKRPILRFKKHGGLLDDSFGESVKNSYLEFARSVDNYITDLYNDWEGSVTSVVQEKLRMPVLCSIAPNANNLGKIGSKDGANFVLPPPPYRVSFSPELRLIIKESRYLDKLGYRVPEAALNVTLQEKKYLAEIIRPLNEKLHEYDRLLGTLTEVEKKLLSSHIDDLNTTIKGGFYPLNWTSQRIPSYIEELGSALEKFDSVISEVHKNGEMIMDIVNKISKTLLIRESDFKSTTDGVRQPLDISEFFEIFEKNRVERLDALVHDYKSIGETFLMKIEGVVARTATGASPVLGIYYHYWERCIYNAITQMIIRSMATYIGMLQCKEGPPLFKLLVSLNGKDLLISPSITEVDKLIAKGGRSIVEAARCFVRWMFGTCLQTEPQVVNEDEEPYVFSFFQDISKNSQVVKLALSLTSLTQKLQDRFTTLEQQVDAETPDLESLKFVLNIIAEIQGMMQDIELEMMDITERYRTLARYSIAVPPQEMTDALSIETRWRTLYCNSRTRDLRLIDTKAQFRQVTSQQDKDFRELLANLRKDFLDKGPGVSSTPLDEGVDLLADYRKKLVSLNKIKAELINAQNLFNLDVKPYPDLQQTQADVDQLSKIYDLYVQFKEFQMNMASTLWGDLDITVLQKGADDFEKTARRFPKDLKEIFTFKLVEAKLANFKEALPLVVSLKNDAMKQRHWQKLMDVTGVTFDVTLKSLTLSNIFSMELHKFTAAIEEIINEAVQEAKIENELAKIEAAWRNNALSVVKYKKDGQDRGWVLRAADDLKLELEDNMLNLQTISGSRFVTAFVDRVRKWEKSLNLVSECLEMWFTVQRKWVYLEGIFIGAEDIRQQLPEEAKRFDAIDKAYKTIMTATSKNPNVVDACSMDNRLSALTFKLGGSPAGPAGTGKTETTKDLAKSLALPCFVINCGDGLDYKAMASIFSGLVQVGAWGCFDEFNRINIEVLSVVSAQLRAIQNALIYDKPTCDIGIGGEMTIKRVAGFATCGFFITMNPGYAGRTELPDNLKALFRPVTMIVPDFLQICEIMLFSEGFEGAKVLAKKMTVLYKLSKEQLSKQYHYDFGLRALKSVLVMAGGLKRQYQEMPEDLVLMRCLRDSNMPKFVFEDVPLFSGLINDLFPGMDCPRVGYEDLKQAAMIDLETRGFRTTQESVFMDQIDKVIQMYETQLVRHTTMIVGPSGGGKSLVLETLKNSRLVAENIVVKMFVLNPKAQPLKELYGDMDPVTRDWTDGILSKLFRELNDRLPPGKENEMRWIVYDGDVDALWVENMNSVMDDNRLLTLPNGERIRLQPHCAMICETFDLQYASPATISRCGMVWVDPKNLGYFPYYERWVRTRYGNGVVIPEEKQPAADVMIALYEKYVPKSIDLILSGMVDGEMGQRLKQVIPVANIDMVKQLCSCLDAFLSLELTDSMFIENIYIYCCMWSLGAALVGESRSKFDSFIKRLSHDPTLPDGLLYDYFFEVNTTKWEKWAGQVPAYAEPSPFKFYEVMVPTTDSILYSHMLQHLAPLRPILFVGESGTAKTTVIQKYLMTMPSSSFSKLNINFSSRTTAADVQTNIEANVDKRSGNIYGPPSGKKLIVFVDDLNMPKVDAYGTQQPIALLLFLMGRGCIYDREKDLNLKLMKDLQYIGAMGPPGGGRNPVDTRFVALFNVFNLNPPTNVVLSNIYNSIITTRYSQFADPVKAAAAKITACTLRLFAFIVEKMPPTPSKFHYIFNLRDLSRVYEGLCNATPDTVSVPSHFARLWRNECDRVFYDRLTTVEDQQTYMKEIQEIVKANFAESLNDVLVEPCLFGDFESAVARISSGGAQEDARLYRDMGNYDAVRKIFTEVLDLYNQENKAMTLVLFEQALEHLCRIHRIIRNPRGNALLVGVGGSGKQSLTRLAAFCAGYKLFQITLARGYGEEQFKTDLKELYKALGLGEVVFLFTDAHVVEEGFLEFINNMLTTGMVPALYEQDEKDALCATVRMEVKLAGLPETPDNLWSFYVNKCRNNLHIVLAMSPSGSKLRLRCRNFPGLVSNAVIDWFFPWPTDALQKVAEYFLADEALPEDQRANIVGHLVFTHQNVTKAASKFAEELRRYYYVTPKNYLDFISNYRQQLAVNSKRITASTKRLEGGLQKLIEAASAVDRMKIVLMEKKVVVDSKTEKVQALIAVIQEKTAIASVSQGQATVKQKYASEQAIIIAQQKGEADEALSEATPAVLAAEAALEKIDKKDLTELKAFANPPGPVKSLGYQLVCLRPTGEKLDETQWNDAKKVLGHPNILNMLKGYQKDSLNEKVVKKVLKAFEGKTRDEALDEMKNVSSAGYGLLTWVVAMLKYYEVAKNVQPLRDKVAAMEKAQAQTEKELYELKVTLDALSKEINELNAQFQEANTELDGLQQEAAIMTKRLNAASQLIDGLTGERTRWSADVASLEQQSIMLVGDCLLGASFLSYMGAFTTDYRRDLVYDKFLTDVNQRGIPLSVGFTLEKLLTTDATVQFWVSKGLPADDHSVQNGILTTKGSRFPLCIDPQQQAVTWIKRTYTGKSLTVKTLTDSDFMKHLELAIQFGNAFLFENVDEELDPMLDPVLEKNIVKEGGGNVIKLGDKVVEWDDNFRLFFTTKLANPHYSPEVMGKTMIINYGVTMDGLANQLLNVVVANERPDLERQWADLVTEMGENAQLLVSLEDTLLRELSSSQGNILDNSDLIATLENTKSKAEEIKGKLELAEQTKSDISVARSVYKPVAKRGSILYFTEAGLATINSMYEISLDSFLSVFKTALETAKKDANLENRLRNMIETITRQIYDYTCTGIFERHKLMFSFQMTCMVMNGEGTLDMPVLDFFLKGDTSLEGVSEACPVTWLIGSGWKDLLFMGGIHEVYGDLVKDFKAHTGVWKTWYDLEAPETVPIPNDFQLKLSPLQRLAVMRCFRPDRVYNAVKLFVMEVMGEKYVQPPVLDYARIFSQSTPTAPMVFILSPGADPQSDIQKFCDEMGMTSRFKFVALGQGQGPIAEQLLEVGYKRGNWVLLQNCHLLASWLKTLEKMLNEMRDPHKDFRLWLTTEPTDKFPLGILQRSLKVVTEPPDGLKLNMRATYSRIDSATLEECPHWAFRPCLYVLAFLHAVVLERRKYGKIGWNVNYDFNESDFSISRRLLSLYLQKSFEDNDEFLPWGSLKYLVGDAMYGGRVSDDMDRRILKTYMEEYMGDFLFDDCQKFSFSTVGFDYRLPEWGELDQYTAMIETLPLTNSPAVFGLHPNAEIGYYTNAVKAMWLDLISLQPRRAGGGEGMSREDYISTTAKDIYSKIPIESMDIGSFDLLQTRALLLRRNKSEDTVTPCQVVLLQELERWNALVKRMASSLLDLQRALVGEIGMSDELDSLGDSLFNGFLPAMWRRLAPDTQKPLGSWMGHFSRRHQQYSKWITTGEPAVMWLSGLHIPESYLTALVQTTCRARGWPLDKSTLYTVVTKHTSEEGLKSLESGCYVAGLYLEGAAWDHEHSVVRAQDPKVLVVELPIMQIIPIEASKLKLHGTFRTPVYVTQARRNAMGVGLVFEADLATHEHSSHWVLQGVALSLNIDS